MSFNPDSDKNFKSSSSRVDFWQGAILHYSFNGIPVNQGITQTRLGMTLDLKLSFEERLKSILTKVRLLDYYASSNPVDTGRKLNVHKTFRRCPGRLLNVLCTFNLRPVSTGKAFPSTISFNNTKHSLLNIQSIRLAPLRLWRYYLRTSL